MKNRNLIKVTLGWVALASSTALLALAIANPGPFAIAPHLQGKKPYDPKKDFKLD